MVIKIPIYSIIKKIWATHNGTIEGFGRDGLSNEEDGFGDF